MKILYVTTISNTVDKFLVPHIESLIEQGHKVDIACHMVRDIREKIKHMKCTVHEIPFSRSPLSIRNVSAYRRVRELITSQNYDLIHTHTPVASFLTRLACRLTPSATVLYTAHGFHFFRRAPIRNWLVYYPLEKLAARWTDGLITMNHEDFEAAKSLRLRKEGAVFLVPGVGVDLEKFRPMDQDYTRLRHQYGYAEKDFILFYAAGLNKNKHQDLLIDAVAHLKNRIPELRLLLAGAGRLEESYKRRVRTLSLEENVHFLGYRSDVPQLFEIADVVVASSRREGLPVNLLEAMAKRKPIVATDTRGHRDLVEDGYNGFLVDLHDPRELAQKIEVLYNSSELRKKLGDNNGQMTMRFSVENVLIEMKKIYEEFLL